MEYPKSVLKETIPAFRFNSEAEAMSAIDDIDEAEGIPANEEALTKTYTLPFEQDGFWYIKADAVTSKYLNGAVSIEVEVK